MKRKYSVCLIISISCLAFFLFCSILYKYDNKYTLNNIKGQKGIIDLSRNDFSRNKIIELAGGWEVYPEKQIKPENLKDQKPELYAVLGQYSGLNFGKKEDSYFGTATYHLKIKLPQTVNAYTLEVPEVFSAYELYINERLVKSYGNIAKSSYKAEMKNSSVSFFAKDYVDVTFIVANYSSFYGGLVYPMAFGLQEDIEQLMNSKLIIHSMFLFLSLFLGTAFLITGIKVNKNYLIYSLMAFMYIVYAGYPVTHSIKSWGSWVYNLEAGCSYAFIALAVYLEDRIYNLNKEMTIEVEHSIIYKRIFRFLKNDMRLFLYWFALFVIIMTLIPAEVICMSYGIMKSVAFLRSIFKYCAFIYLIIISAGCVIKDVRYSKLMLIGFCIAGTSYFADRVYPFFEPVRSGWFYEISGFILLCIIGTVLTCTFAESYRRNENLKVQLDMQKNYYDVVQDNIMNSRKLRHNIKNHILVMKSLMEKHDDKRLWSYLEKYTEELPQIKELVFTNNPELNVIISYYYNTAINRNIEMNIKSFNMPDNMEGMEPDLCVLIGNLLKNAVEACEKVKEGKPVINVSGKCKGRSISVIVSNTYDKEPEFMNNTFISSKRNHKEGIGIPTIKSIANKYNGQYKFKIDKKKSIFEVYIMLFNIKH